jgi:hypothetical protein
MSMAASGFGLPESGVLVVTALLAVGVPVGAKAWVGARTDALAEHLSRAAGVPARIGGVDAELTGTVRLTDVAFGRIASARSIEGSVALQSLLDGQLRADELRVAEPRVAISVDKDGDSDLARLVRRLAGSGAHHPGGAARVRRIVVSSGTLVAQVAGLGELEADQVELLPEPGGVRVITGRVRMRGGAGPVHGELAFARSAAEVSLPHARFQRVLAVAGDGSIAIAPRAPGAPRGIAVLHEVAVGRLAPGGPLELRAQVDDGGAPRALSAALDPRDFAITLRGDHVPLAPLAALAPHTLDLAGARASGTLVARVAGPNVELDLDGAVDGLALVHPAVSALPLPLSGRVHGAIAVSPQAITVASASLDLGAAHWTISGWLRRGAPASGQLDVHLAPAPCAALLASLPAELHGPLDGMVMTGTFGGHARLTVDLAAPVGDGVDLETSLDNACDVTTEPPAADVSTLAGPAEQVFADGSTARVGKGLPGWVALHQLAPATAGAFVAAEDGRFFDHHGFDQTQIARSLEVDLRDRTVARGGSTISQQLIKNSFLSQRRSLDRKLQEAILTWRLEARLDKRTILERYLNVIELGPHVFGISAAAHHWFGVASSDLTIRQAAFLAALTAEPRSTAERLHRAHGLDDETAARIDVVLRAMFRDGIIDKDQLDHARDAGLHLLATALRGAD